MSGRVKPGRRATPEFGAGAVRHSRWTALALSSLLLATLVVNVAHAQVWPTTGWTTINPDAVNMDDVRLQEARDYALTGGGSGMIARGGYLVASWGDQRTRYDIKSATKSLGGTVLGIALADNIVRLTDLGQEHLPTLGLPPDGNATTGWLDDVTLLQLATHASGFEKAAGYGALLHAPGTVWLYSNGGVNWLADILTQVYREDLNSLLFRRVLQTLGVKSSDLVWRSNAYRDDTLDGIKRRELASGFRINVDAMGRIGYLYLRGGAWAGQQLLPASYVETVSHPVAQVQGLPVVDPAIHPDASHHYGVLWWTNADSSLPNVPADAYWAWGLNDNLVVVVPSLDIVAVRASATGFGGRTAWSAEYDLVAPFITPIVQAVSGLAVPDVAGIDAAVAESTITAAGLTLGNVTSVVSESAAPGSVIGQNPMAGTSVIGGSPVDLVVSAGEATAPAFELMPTSLGFGMQALNVTSAAKVITLSSTGSAPLEVTSIGLAGANVDQFSLTTTCQSAVAPGEACVIEAQFRPTSTGSKSAAVTVSTVGASGTKSVALAGTGVRATYSLAPTTVDFGTVARNTQSAASNVVLINTGVVALPINSISLAGTHPKQFSQSNTCGSIVPIGGSCAISVVFKPTSTGQKSATLNVNTGGGASTKKVTLSGVGS